MKNPLNVAPFSANPVTVYSQTVERRHIVEDRVGKKEKLCGYRAGKNRAHGDGKV